VGAVGKRLELVDWAGSGYVVILEKVRRGGRRSLGGLVGRVAF